jgi:addiction module HigA family antidote
MTIKREDIDNKKVDLSDVTSGRRPPVHPGEILRDEFLTPMGISAYELANAVKTPRSRINDVVLGRRSITIDTAMRLGRYFGTSAEFWINLQARHDLDVANRTRRSSAGRLARQAWRKYRPNDDARACRRDKTGTGGGGRASFRQTMSSVTERRILQP